VAKLKKSRDEVFLNIPYDKKKMTDYFSLISRGLVRMNSGRKG